MITDDVPYHVINRGNNNHQPIFFSDEAYCFFLESLRNRGGGHVALTDALNHATGYEYDLAGRLTRETDPLNRETNRTYDAKGNMLTRTKPDSRTITYTYDAANRLTQKAYPGGATAQYQYDASGNLTYAANAAIAYTLAYDANNRLTSVTDSNNRTIQYQYDAAGNRTATIMPENHTIAYGYDNARRLTSITSGSLTFTMGYNTASRRTSLSYPNGASAAYTYDNSGNLTRLAHTGPGATALADINHTYDAVNNRLSRTDTTTSSEPAGSETLTYDAANELLTLNATTYSHDPNGNRTRKSETAGNTTYTYDDENRLVQVQTPDGQVITYAYDPFGRRIEKNVGGTITRYLYDGEDILLEYDASGNVTARYIHGPGIDEPLAMEKNAQMYYYHADTLGTIVALTDSAGALVESYRYDAFGNITSGAPTIAQPYTYTAREHDPETGLYYYRARYYDPIAGRFLQRDPIGFAGGDVNLYAYVKNDPVNWIDPEGLWVAQAVGAALGGGLNAYNNYGRYTSGQMSGADYAKSIVFGAGTGMLSSLGGPALGALLSSLNNVNEQMLWSNNSRCGNIDWGQVGKTLVTGYATGNIAKAAFKTGDLILWYPKQIGGAIGSNVPMIPSFGRAFGITADIAGSILGN